MSANIRENRRNVRDSREEETILIGPISVVQYFKEQRTSQRSYGLHLYLSRITVVITDPVPRNLLKTKKENTDRPLVVTKIIPKSPRLQYVSYFLLVPDEEDDAFVAADFLVSPLLSDDVDAAAAAAVAEEDDDALVFFGDAALSFVVVLAVPSPPAVAVVAVADASAGGDLLVLAAAAVEPPAAVFAAAVLAVAVAGEDDLDVDVFITAFTINSSTIPSNSRVTTP